MFYVIPGQLKLKQNLRHIWGDMTYYRPSFDIFFGGGGRVPPVPRGIYAPALTILSVFHEVDWAM